MEGFEPEEHEDPREMAERKEETKREETEAQALEYNQARDAAGRTTTPDPEKMSRSSSIESEDTTSDKGFAIDKSFLSLDKAAQQDWIANIRAQLKVEVAKLGNLFEAGKEMKTEATPSQDATLSLLGIDGTSPELKDITKNYRRTSLLIHPDKYNPANPTMADAATKILDAQGVDHATPPTKAEAQRAFQELSSAYEKVSDPEKLSTYLEAQKQSVDQTKYEAGKQVMRAAKQAREVISALRSVLDHLDTNTTITQKQLQAFTSEAAKTIELLQAGSQGQVPHPDGVSDLDTYMKNLVVDIMSQAQEYGDFNITVTFPNEESAAMFGLDATSNPDLKTVTSRYNKIVNFLQSTDPASVQKAVAQVLGDGVPATRQTVQRALQTVQNTYNTIIA
jgi:curved DNA-binding protein CbpA